jgi:hypothetical protein
MAYEWESKTNPSTVSPGDVAGRLRYWADEYDRLTEVVISLHKHLYRASSLNEGKWKNELRHARYSRDMAAARMAGNVRGVLAELEEWKSNYAFSSEGE